ncbi:hypothetical protein V3595_27815 [Bacillus sp. CFBP9009]
MNILPEANDFLSLFECEPALFDTTEEDLPYYYNKARYQFSNGEEDYIVTLSPSYGEVKIQVTQMNSNKVLSILNLKRVNKFEITADKRELSSVLLTVLHDDSQQTIEIDFKPKYKLIIREHYTR